MEAIKSTDTERILAEAKNYKEVVILSAEKYNEYETMLSIGRAKADIAAGRVYPAEEVFARLEEKLKDL